MDWLMILMLIYGACLLYIGLRAAAADRREKRPAPPALAPPAAREAWEVPAEAGFRVMNER